MHQIDAVHELRHRMLDLQARVHLEEVIAAVLVQHEFAGAGIDVIYGLRGANCRGAHLGAKLRC